MTAVPSPAGEQPTVLMNVKTARAAIEAILAAIPDEELPEFDSVDLDDERPTVWCGGTGYILGSATSNGTRDPLNYRRNGARAAIEAEMTYRADRRFLANGDDPAGLILASKWKASS